VVRLCARTKTGTYARLYRRIVLWVEDQQPEMAFFTNHLHWGATTVTAVYKDRWQIESFFKSLKQLLRVKTFAGTSPNALKTQIGTALIAMLLLKYLQLRSTFGWSLSNRCALLRQQLFVYRDLFPWRNDPFPPPPALHDWHDRQLSLEWPPSKLDSNGGQPAFSQPALPSSLLDSGGYQLSILANLDSCGCQPAQQWNQQLRPDFLERRWPAPRSPQVAYATLRQLLCDRRKVSLLS
jgi:Transposase DDE domain